jgi:ribosomal protein L30E
VPTLKRIIVTKKIPDDKDSQIQNKAKEMNIEILSFNKLRVRIQT